MLPRGKIKSKNHDHKVFSAKHAGRLDRKIRVFLQNPKRILKPFIKEGMSVLDLGCGPGFFTVEMSKLAGKKGSVTASDLQEEMLDIVKTKFGESELSENLRYHKCGKNKIGLKGKFDFVLIFYVLHETNQESFIGEGKDLLKDGGKALIVEPKFRVTEPEFNDSINAIKNAGLFVSKGPRILFSRSAVVEKKS